MAPTYPPHQSEQVTKNLIIFPRVLGNLDEFRIKKIPNFGHFKVFLILFVTFFYLGGHGSLLHVYMISVNATFDGEGWEVSVSTRLYTEMSF